MGFKKVVVEGSEFAFRNVPGSAVTRVIVGGEDAFGFDPDTVLV